MSSEVITQNDLTSILDAVIPKSANKISYDSDITTLFNTPWTCPESGLMIMEVGSMTGGGTTYCYMRDKTGNNRTMGLISKTADGTYNTVCFPVIKGHEYEVYAKSAVNVFHAYYYKFSFVNQPAGYYRGYVSTSNPTSSDGENGDIWIKYST